MSSASSSTTTERRESPLTQCDVMADSVIPGRQLRDGSTVPAVGFGTYPLRGAAGVEAVRSAIAQGYRLLDSAFNYDNEGAVGEAVRTCGVPRSDLRVSSKLPGRFQAYDDAIAAIRESAYRTGLDYLDLYLIHWPNPRQGLYVKAWRALVEAQRQGLVRSIGVSNFLPEHLDRIISETGVTPSVNQIEVHPSFPQVRQRAFDDSRGIVTQSWTPLGGQSQKLLAEPAVVAPARAHGKTPTQVVLRWHLQLGALPLPKAANPDHQRENSDIFDFELTQPEMTAITALGRPDGRSSDQDPATHEEF